MGICINFWESHHSTGICNGAGGTGTDTRRVFTTNDAKADRRYTYYDPLPRRVRAHRDASPSTHMQIPCHTRRRRRRLGIHSAHVVTSEPVHTNPIRYHTAMIPPASFGSRVWKCEWSSPSAERRNGKIDNHLNHAKISSLIRHYWMGAVSRRPDESTEVKGFWMSRPWYLSDVYERSGCPRVLLIWNLQVLSSRREFAMITMTCDDLTLRQARR